ncbi:MAG: VWA domain-containing protein [Polyangiaceae bacterium]
MSEGALALNVLHFARVLRAAGLPIGTAAVLDALRALTVIDATRKDDFRACLRAVLVHRHEHETLFDEAFRLFFRDPFGAEEAMSALLPRAPPAPDRPDVSRRVAEALHPQGTPRPAEPPKELVEIEVALVATDEERLQTRDFEEMSAEELRLAREAVSKMRFFVEPVPVRRTRPARTGEVDLRATLRAALRGGGRDIPLRFRRRREQPPPVCVLCDISGSMGRYTEMLLRFLHVLVNQRERVFAFLFGTRLTNVTRALRHRDADVALRKCGLEVQDWAGGTRIGASLDEFNRRWSRRVLGQGAIVLLITDGLDREAAEGLPEAADRLHRSCRRLVWLNPLLRFEGFEPRAGGIRALLPHVDDFRPAHNLQSLEQLAGILAAPSPRREDRHLRGLTGRMSAA